MGTIDVRHFETEDPDNPGYSLVEYDLYGRLGLTIRKNLNANMWEIVDIKTGEVHYMYRSVADIVRMANTLEGAENTDYEI